MPERRIDTLSLVRPLPWVRAIADLRFTPENWGPGVFRLAAPNGAHLLIRRHGAPEQAFWLPARLSPVSGEPFGLYVHHDQSFAARLNVAGRLRRVLGVGAPPAGAQHPDANRLAAMLCVYDLGQAGLSLRDIADRLLLPVPDDWRASSQRSDLRRLKEAGRAMVDQGYLSLLNSARQAT